MVETQEKTATVEGFERLLSLEEAADVLGVSLRTTKELTHSGDLVSLKVRRWRLVDPRYLREYVSRQRAAGGRVV